MAFDGARSWWAHFEFTRINIAPTILSKKIEGLREARALKSIARWTNRGGDVRCGGEVLFRRAAEMLLEPLHHCGPRRGGLLGQVRRSCRQGRVPLHFRPGETVYRAACI